MSIDPKFVSTGFEFPGYRIAKTLGVVRGIVVRSRSIIGNVGASLQTSIGRQHHNLYRDVRARPRRRPPADDRARRTTSRQRDHWRALRRQRNHRRRNRSAGLWHRGAY